MDENGVWEISRAGPLEEMKEKEESGGFIPLFLPKPGSAIRT